jgi:epoxyqueuosine reductase
VSHPTADGARLRRLAAEAAERHGLRLLGVTGSQPLPIDRAVMQTAVDEGRMGRMDWMGGTRPGIATDPRRHDPQARSVIVLAAPYAGRDERSAWDPEPDALEHALARVLGPGPAVPAGQIARYALGTDYHVALRERLASVAADLRDAGVGVSERSFVDDRPLAERGLAARAGLGWIGKNTNLLTHQPAGSWILLGELLVTDELPADQPIRSSCGDCTRCLTGCPTGALVGPRTIDARRCISYLSIEHPGAFSEGESAALGSWVFGCDVCQEVCPVNGAADDRGALAVPLVPLVEWLAPLGARAFDRAVGHTALRRATRHRLLRNALAALANASRTATGPWPEETTRRARAAVAAASGDRRAEVRAEATRATRALDAGATPAAPSA